MGKTILKKVPDEDVWFEFEDEVCLWDNKENVVIAGNDDFKECGDSTLLAIIKGSYYDDDETTVERDDGTCYDEEIGYDYETLEELEKYTGKKWDVRTMTGYSQSDWQELYYVVDEVNDARLDEIENFYFGKVDEFKLIEDEDNPDDVYNVFIPHDVVWDGKKAICKYLDLDEKETVVYEDDGYEKVTKYKEMK